MEQNKVTGLVNPWTSSATRWGCGLALLLMTTAILIACGGRVERPAPNFSFTLYQGADSLGAEEIELSHLLDGRPVVLNFWAGLCPPCRAEMPDFQKFYEESRGEVIIIGIDIGQFVDLGSQQDAEDLLHELDVTYPTGFISDPEIIRSYEVVGMPTTVFIDSRGEIFEKWTGLLNRQVLERITDAMLKRDGKS